MLLSVALAVRNEERNLAECLSSVSGLGDEIVVVDGSSSDRTVEIARNMGARVIRTENRKMFHINKQMALSACKGDWILQLDADEVVTPELGSEIKKTLAANPEENGFRIPRKNYFWGHFMAKGGQYPDYVIRLVRRGKASFPCKSVHEQIEIDGKVGVLVQPMLHFSYRSRADYWKKAESYTSLTASEYLSRGMRPSLTGVLRYCILLPVWTFLLIFLRHKGFVDGVTGFEFALYSGLHSAIAYRKFMREYRSARK